ncbi:hypothetical protein ERJ75_000261600 [Trypanosoma vivax]|nr:hypothetical protein ERJ75_000261600 [Trypanosoma vivax]
MRLCILCVPAAVAAALAQRRGSEAGDPPGLGIGEGNNKAKDTLCGFGGKLEAAALAAEAVTAQLLQGHVQQQGTQRFWRLRAHWRLDKRGRTRRRGEAARHWLSGSNARCSRRRGWPRHTATQQTRPAHSRGQRRKSGHYWG